jgi:hypothetical protein
VLLCLIAAWIGIVWYAESAEMLEDKTSVKQKPIQNEQEGSKGGAEAQIVATASIL